MFKTVEQRIDHRSDEKRSNLQLISLYHDIPQEELSVDEFEMMALDRLQLLRGIEVLQTRGFDGKELNNKIYALENKYMPLRSKNAGPLDSFGRTADQRKDMLSHFILRAAYCRTEDLRLWFIKQECNLLKCRLDRLTDFERSQFMANQGLEYEQVSADEKLSLRDKLWGLCDVVNEGIFASTVFYKIPFQQALQLISTRSVYLERGYAYVPLQRLVSIIVARFRAMLSRALAAASSAIENVSDDPRVGPLLKNMNKQYVGKDFAKNTTTDKLTPDKVDGAADAHMPLCMKFLHMNLKKDHKLKHWGRLQYGLFLKGAGLTAEDAQLFWETHFTKVMNHDQYMKNYSYTFRHMYGKEGSRKNYTPFSCMKIIMGTPPEPGAYHGCPYRHQSDAQLAALLGSLKIGGTDAKEIIGLAKSSNYQVACQRHFDIMHPGHQNMDVRGSEAAANHPNQWYSSSVQYHKLKNGGTNTNNNSNSSSNNVTTMATAANAGAGAGAGTAAMDTTTTGVGVGAVVDVSSESASIPMETA